MAASGTGVPTRHQRPGLRPPNESIPAKELIGFKTDLAAKEPSIPLAYNPPAQGPLPADDFVSVEGVTFEDLENQYKSQRAGVENVKPESTANVSD
jgi:hypothetical protein